MQLLRRLTLVDLALVAALIVTGILWASSRSDSPPDPSAIIANLDMTAWNQATALATGQTAAGNLRGVQSALDSAANIAEAAGDRIAASGIRSFAATMTGINVGAVQQALAGLVPFPDSPLFADVYLAIWTPLFYPAMPVAPPEPGAEWVHLNVVTPRPPVDQHWGTANWYLPEGVTDSAGEADLTIPDLGLNGKLMFAIGGDDLQMTLVFTGPLDDETIIGAVGFWIASGDEEALLVGEPLLVGDGVVIMALLPAARDRNNQLLQTADEIRLAIDFSGDRRYVFRIEVGDTGRALLRETLGSGT